MEKLWCFSLFVISILLWGVCAEDLSSLSCSASDVRIRGYGEVINEPCNCEGNFTAVVKFVIENNANSNRYCFTLHLCTDPPAVLRIDTPIKAKTTSVYYAEYAGYPCGAGTRCFGYQNGDSNGLIASCPNGECCNTLSYTTHVGDNCPPNPPSKCEHLPICITSRSVSLNIIDDPTDDSDSLTPTCGGTATVALCVDQGGIPPFQFNLTDGTNEYTPYATKGENCALYKLQAYENVVLQGTVTDSDEPPCGRSTTFAMPTVSLPTPFLFATTSDCSGSVVVSVENCVAGLNYTFSYQGSVLQTGPSCTYATTLPSGTTCIDVSVTNGDAMCEKSATICINVKLVSASLALSSLDCFGNAVLTATAQGGTGEMSYYFFHKMQLIQEGTSDKLSKKFLPGDYCVMVVANDSIGCSSSAEHCFTVQQGATGVCAEGSAGCQAGAENPCGPNGVCQCGVASSSEAVCVCRDGWQTLDPRFPCASKCGDGIVQPGEECDSSPCCTSTCKMIKNGEPCSAPEGSECLLPGFCQEGSCVYTELSCPTAGLCQESICNKQTGRCERKNLADGTVCSRTPCVESRCMAGSCTVTSISVGAECVPDSPKDCRNYICTASGQCIEGPLFEEGASCGTPEAIQAYAEEQGINPSCVFGSCSINGECVFSATDLCKPSNSDSDDGDGKKAAIIGALVGAGALAGMLGALAAWMYRRRKKQEEEAGESFEDIADRMENSGPSNVLQMSNLSQENVSSAEGQPAGSDIVLQSPANA